eukprot:TRINITY_DN2049_c2_g1_i1.p1 TRINITY_DN2049_c2_g1~~TRINITY_DN2049_c2_g1_i1.p1  ORF type:complete len:1746 (+),score=479.29 TRINITY_DN2049_c2_g1_i1:57-5294(+)
MKKEAKKQEAESEPRFPSQEYVGTILNCFSCDFTKLANIHVLDEFTILTATGNLVLKIEIETKKVDWILGRDGGGIGALCVHPSKEYFAVAEKIGSQSPPNSKPHVFIYNAQKELYKTLTNGTECMYTACNFSSSGDKLATVGGHPDYMLTVWNWKEECVILRFKAWGSEVFRVTFNSNDDGFLTTSGIGHIKFWEMAKTFTGLKLQGAIGKFGKVDIQDLMGYVELPDGKVLSGSQTGALLMWEANLLKAEILMKEGAPCHKGPIEVVMLLEGEVINGVQQRVFMSAGNDGYMRYWKFTDIDMADTTDNMEWAEVECLREVLIDDQCCIRSLTSNKSHWIIQDANGKYWKSDIIPISEIISPPESEDQVTKVISTEFLNLHAGAITCVEASPNEYCCATGGVDGTLRLWSFLHKKELYHSRYSSGFSTLHWVPLEHDKSGTLLVAGFSCGLIRVIKKTKTCFVLCSVWKPHTCRVTSVSFDEKYEWAATTSEDGSIFFFRIKNIQSEWVPIGESRLSSVGRCSFWEGNNVIIGLEDGKVVSVPKPDPASIDPEITFIFECTESLLQYRQRPKPPERPSKKRDLTSEDDELGEDEEEEEDEDDFVEEVIEDKGPVPINAIFRMPESLGKTLVVAMDREEYCYTYAGVSWPQTGIEVNPEDPIFNVSHYDTVVNRVRLSPKGTYLMLGCGSGTIMLRDAAGLKKCWHLNIGHDGRNETRQSGACLPGTILGLCMSFDESILLSVSEDGSFLTYSLSGVPDAPEPPPAAPLDISNWEKPGKSIADAPAGALSIQEMKNKEDKDRAYAAAQRKKLTLSEKVKELQSEYQLIVNANSEAPPGKKITKDELELDPEITQLLHDENERRIQEVAKKWAWHTAKSDLAKAKLEATYIDCLKVDRIMLYAFESQKCVSSFRTPELTDIQKERIASVHSLIMNENQKRMNATAEAQDQKSPVSECLGEGELTGSPGDDTSNMALPMTANSIENGNDTITSLDHGSTKRSKKEEKTHVKSQLEKAEERKRQRMERKMLYNQLLEKKPSADQEDPKDVQQIQKAERNMGDKKLKTDPNYIVKETERVTAERKERQLILLEESINTLRLDFNERFIAMRDLKERLITNINRDLKKIESIDNRLKIEVKTDKHSMRDDEIPDKQRQVPPTKDMLVQYEKDCAKAKRKAEREAKAKSGFGGDLGGDDEEDDDEAPQDEVDRIAQARKASLRSHNRRESHTITAEMRINLELKTRLEKLPKSSLEIEEESVTRNQLMFEKAKLQRKIAKTITTFDDALDELRREKFKLEGDLKMADMRILLLFRELVLLREFKKKDMILSKRLDEHRNEKLEVNRKTNDCQNRLTEKKEEIKRLLDREQEILTDMLQLLTGLAPAMKDSLMRIFRKRVRRKVQKGEEESEESSSDDWTSDEEEDDQQEEEDTCPEGCDEEVYQAVLNLRTRRLDQEDVVAEFQKSMEQLKRENESLSKGERATNQKLLQVEKEIQTFQTEKQQKLNQLETSIVLKLSQVQALIDDSKIPADQTDLIIFTNGGMRDLCNRIVQLQTDKKVLNKEHNEYKRTHLQLLREKRGTEARVKEWEQKVYEVQLLKFGQRVDLESLEDVSVDRQTEELKEKLRQEEIHWEKAMRIQVQALKKFKEQQQQVISTNSQLLRELAELNQEQQRLEEHLNVSQSKILTRMAGGSRVATTADRSNLKDLVVMQQREIDTLKSEIAMLRRKGGHVYTPVVSKVVATDPNAKTG